jgi:hypothetical protein
MEDERWHISWVRGALKDLEGEYGAEHVRATVRRYQQADREVYAATLREHEDRLGFLASRAGSSR